MGRRAPRPLTATAWAQAGAFSLGLGMTLRDVDVLVASSRPHASLFISRSLPPCRACSSTRSHPAREAFPQLTTFEILFFETEVIYGIYANNHPADRAPVGAGISLHTCTPHVCRRMARCRKCRWVRQVARPTRRPSPAQERVKKKPSRAPTECYGGIIPAYE